MTNKKKSIYEDGSYAEAHPLYNWYFQTESQTSIFDHSQTKVILDLWWKPQITFNSIMHQLVEYLESQGINGYKIPCVTAISKVWKVPVYYRARDWDIWLENSFSIDDIAHIDKKAQWDYKMLAQWWINASDYEQFINDFKINNNI